MEEWFNNHILPILISSGFMTFIGAILLPTVLRIIYRKNKYLKRQIEEANAEVAKLKGITSALSAFNKDIEDIKKKSDYTQVIAASIQETVTDPMIIMQNCVTDMLNMCKIVHDSQLQTAKAMQLAWGNKVEGVNDALTIAPTLLELHKKEEEITNLKNAIREIKGEDADIIITKCVEVR